MGRKLVFVVLVAVVGIWVAGCSKDSLQSELEKALGDIDILKQDVAALKSGRPDTQILKQTIAEQTAVIAALRTDLDDCKKNIETLQQEVDKGRGTAKKTTTTPTTTPKPKPKKP